MGNPRYKTDPTSNRMYLQILANLDRRAGEFAGTARHLASAFQYGATPDLVMRMTMTLIEANRFDAAGEFLQKMKQAGPRNPLKSLRWRRNVDELSVFVSAVAANEG